jgi:hypothetical protein
MNKIERQNPNTNSAIVIVTVISLLVLLLYAVPAGAAKSGRDKTPPEEPEPIYYPPIVFNA